MKFKHILVLTLLLILTSAYSQDLEDFESGDFTSFDWEFAGEANWSVTTYQPFDGNFCAQAGNIDDDETSILQVTIETAVDGDVSFQWKVSSQFDEDLLVFYIDNTYYGIISGDHDWEEFSEPLEAGIHTLKWKYQKNDNTDDNLDTAWIDNISFPQLTDYEHNIAAYKIIGNQIVYSNDSGVYEIAVKNFGNAIENNYTVDLYREGDVLLESRNITEELHPGEKRIHQMVWFVPEDEEPATTYVYGKVTLPTDEFTDNDETNLYGVEILPGGLVEVQIGTGNELNNWCPMAFRLRNSITQTLYFPEEIGTSGEVIAVGYRNDFETNLFNKPTRVWMAMTTAPSLNDGWVNPNQMTEVFNGNINFPSGSNRIIIQFQETVMYNGINNLAIHVNRPYETDNFSFYDEFLSTHSTPGHPGRTRSVSSDTQNMNPLSPPNGFVFNRLPNTSLFIVADNLGGVTGIISDDSGNEITEAEVTIQGPNKSTVSNGAGEYLIGNVEQSVYDITASKFGYESDTQAVTILTDQVVAQDFTLVPLDSITLSGTVALSDDPENGVEGAYVTLSGYGSYLAITDEEGDFSIPGVFADQEYHLQIYYPGYDQYSYYFTTMGFDLYLGMLVLSETAYPVRGVEAVEIVEGDDEIAVQLDWIAPIAFRSLESYTIHRFQEDEIDNPDAWDLITEAVTDTSYLDTSWDQLYGDLYKYAVTAVYTNDIIAEPTFSDVVVKNTGSDENSIPGYRNLLFVNFPNPFNPITNISYEVAVTGNVILDIYNTKGQLVETLVSEEKTAGTYTTVWNAETQSSGIYFYKISTGDFTETKKMVLLK
jgi:hypothetical protein